jgi:hypothetical protein
VPATQSTDAGFGCRDAMMGGIGMDRAPHPFGIVAQQDRLGNSRMSRITYAEMLCFDGVRFRVRWPWRQT